MLRRALRCVASEGRVLLIGFASGDSVDASSTHLLMKNYGVLGVFVGAYPHEARLPVHQDLLARWAKGELRVPIDGEVDFAELPAALTDLEQPRARQTRSAHADLAGARGSDR